LSNEKGVRQVKENVIKLKELLRKAHEGVPLDILKKELKEALSGLNPFEVVLAEQELLKEGFTPQEIFKVCDIHVEMLRDSLLKVSLPYEVPVGHPLHDLISENEELLKDLEKLSVLSQALKESGKKDEILEEIYNILKSLRDFKKHYRKLQALVFPYLERRGITAVPRVLWSKEDQAMLYLRNLLNEIEGLKASKDFSITALNEVVNKIAFLTREFTDIVFRESKILFPAIQLLFSEGEWVAIKESESDIGFYKVRPEAGVWKPSAEPIYPYQIRPEVSEEVLSKLPAEFRAVVESRGEFLDIYNPAEVKGRIKIGDGYLTLEELESLINALPVEISFIDANDRFVFYSKNKDKIFVRTKVEVGRPVEFCHPPRSVHIVKKIVEEFKAGKRDSADFWINMGGRLIYIKYLPVRSPEGKYLGTLEVVQDITDIKKIEGEKRLLD